MPINSLLLIIQTACIVWMVVLCYKSHKRYEALKVLQEEYAEEVLESKRAMMQIYGDYELYMKKIIAREKKKEREENAMAKAIECKSAD